MTNENSTLHERFLFREIRPEDPQEMDYAVYMEQVCEPPTDACTREEILDRAQAAPELFLAAVDRATGEIAGYINGVATDETVFRDEFFSEATSLHDPDGSIVMLTGLNVMPKYRLQGLGRELVQETVRRERARGRSRLILTCIKEKIEMYEKFGFHYMGVSESVYGGTVWYDMDIALGEEHRPAGDGPGFAEAFIDLHLHLDGALTVEIARRLAQLQGIELPEDDAELERLLTVPEDCRSLNDFLECFELPQTLMQTEEGLRESVRLVADNVLSQGTVYAEIRLAPQNHTKQGLSQEDVIRAALEGITKTDLKTNLILCCLRGADNDAENEETVELAGKYLVEDGGVVALDLAGAEALYPTEKYRALFEKARGLGIPFTIHAGEADGAQSVRLAVEYGARRIGHGVRSYEDPEVVRLLKEKNITLEMCPTSNRQTHALEDMADYPFMEYLKQGLKVTLNTDDMGIEGTTLAREHLYMRERFGMTAEQERQVLENAVDGAFTTDEVKARLRSAVLPE